MNNLDIARKQIVFLFSLVAPDKQIDSWETETIIDQIIFELLKEVVDSEYKEKKKSEKKSLNQISGKKVDRGTEANLKLHSRKMQYSNYYREDLAKRLKTEYDFSSPDLDIKDMSALGKRHPGYQLSRYDIEQLKAMEELVILKNIVNRRITDQKKIPKAELIYEYIEYQDYFKTLFNPEWRKINNMTDDQMCSPILTDTDFILYNILLYTTELKYHVISVYLLADKISEYYNKQTSDMFSENYFKLLSCFNAFQEFNFYGKLFLKENSLLFLRHSIIEIMDLENIYVCVDIYIKDLKLCAVVKDLIKNQTNVLELIKESSNEERKKFIEKHYPVYKVIYTPLEWNNEKVKCLRNLYSNLIFPIAPPIIK
ncbi:MAG: hypothetical protein K5979_09960 [Ruminococcus sp.]|nr:hypothetical protein [Ruminococcus sp.]